jgi:hypothetical protein
MVSLVRIRVKSSVGPYSLMECRIELKGKVISIDSEGNLYWSVKVKSKGDLDSPVNRERYLHSLVNRESDLYVLTCK